ncbi:hypothetical protein EMPS_09773 [Entomortierella parvispora]|uniref:RNA helicase n=1 Tax=Entomortierella parvispora TaxID=205924 RepID=A0A9P3HIM2_9FUNG|nr:hypothetical protein EMPS_09773 [Entomortierella parvispora]
MSIQEPTLLQQTFIPPILQHKDVLIRDTTGSGKTFGVLLSLLNKPRVKDAAGRPGITSVIVVPNQELAFQLVSWTKDLFPALADDPDQLNRLIQVLVVPSSAPSSSSPPDSSRVLQKKRALEEEKQVERLSEALPHVLVATPNRLWALIQQGVLDLSGIETLVLDEVDNLIQLPTRFASQKRITNRSVHPTSAELAVREILRSAKAAGRYKELAEAEVSPEGDSDNSKGVSTAAPLNRIQFVVASATMNRPIRYWLESHHWIQNAEWVDTTKSVVLPEGIRHHCMIVGPDSVRNMKKEPSVPWNERNARGSGSSGAESDWQATDQEWKNDGKDLDWKKKQISALKIPGVPQGDLDESEAAIQKFRDDDDRMLEGVAMACMLDKVESACVFFCSPFSLREIANRLEFEFGLPVKQIDGAFDQKHRSLGSRPLAKAGDRFKGIYLAHESNARGLDLPGLSHVYIVGLPSAPSSYLHMAGRTGRMGQKGTVVTILRDDDHLEDRARSLFNTLNVSVEPFEHIE